MSPVEVTVTNDQGGSIFVDGAGSVTVNPGIVGVAAGFGDHQKMVLFFDNDSSNHQLHVAGSGAQPGDTFSLVLANIERFTKRSVEFLGAPTGEDANAFLDLELDPDLMILQVDEDGDGEYEQSLIPYLIHEAPTTRIRRPRARLQP